MLRDVAGISALVMASWLVACDSETKDANGCDPGVRCADGAAPSTEDGGTHDDAGEHADAGDDSGAVDLDAGVAAASIGPEAGTVSLPDGASVEIPAGALGTKTRIEIRVMDADDLPALPSGQALRGRAYAFEPHGQRFDTAVTLHLPFEGDSHGLSAVRLDDEHDTSWQTVSGGKAGTDHVLELRVTHFSIYAVAGTSETPDAAVVASCDADNGGCGDPSFVKCVKKSGTAPSCKDIDECEIENGGCDPLAPCENIFGAPPTCGPCPSGYSGSGDSGCIDIDECAAGLIAACGGGATKCTNTTGDYACTCNAQHIGSGTHQCSLPLYCGQPQLFDENCYAFQAHTMGENTKYTVTPGETVTFFYFDVPWAANSVASGTGFIVDTASVVADAWLYDTGSSTAAGTVSLGAGTVVGEDAALLDHWGPGGCDLTLPDDVGLHLPDPGRRIILSMHYNNVTDAAQYDTSAFRVCTVAAASRAHIAALTLLGTEDLESGGGIVPGMNTFSGTCTNDTGAPITLISLTPHVHKYGTWTKATVSLAAGGSAVVLDQPYDFNFQVRYDAFNYVMNPGDQIATSCTFNNSTSNPLGFGLSTQQEMCYVFALAYPYPALNSGVPSLLGPTNTCW